ncbi:MAG: MBL fold metallo-hydrolase [Planctomycetota bacterium]
MKRNKKAPASEHFAIHELSEGVYAAIGIEGKAAYSNAGIIDCGEFRLIFDTFESPLAAADLLKAADQLAGRKTTHVIISHSHPDHWLGNQVFSDEASIISTHENLEQMAGTAKGLEQLRTDPSTLEKMIDAHEARIPAEANEHTRDALANLTSRWRYTLESLPTLSLQLPTQTFSNKFAFHGSLRSALLLAAGPGHSASDCFLVLPEDKIVFMGDLLFTRSQPFMAFADPQAWLAQVADMEQADISTFVPGHGPLGTREDLVLQKQYIMAMEEMVAGVIQEGGSVEDALRKGLPAPFDAWITMGMSRYEVNVQSSFGRQTGT